MVRENMGVIFARAMAKHIPRGHPLYHCLNKHTMKCSYSTMPSMGSKVGAHNNGIERKVRESENPPKKCNCPKGKTCIWGGRCEKEVMVYKCVVRDPAIKVKIANYIWGTGGKPKIRISVHMNTFKDRAKVKKSTIATKIWELKDAGKPYELEWGTLVRAKARGPNQMRCNVCFKEALKIMRKDKLATNKRKELGATCLHRRRHILKNIKYPDPILP